MVSGADCEAESEVGMNGTRPKCPNMVPKVVASLVSQGPSEGIHDVVPCGDERYEVINPHPFSRDSGLDPLAVLVRCKGCGTEYYVFPALSCPAGARR